MSSHQMTDDSNGATGVADTARPRHFLILNNVQKVKNIKNMLTSASAFGVCEVFVVGQKKFDLEAHAAFLSSLRCPITRLPTLQDCRAHCQALGIRIIGVEIMASARSISERPFSGDTAFIMGNEVQSRSHLEYAMLYIVFICGWWHCVRFCVQGSGMNSAQVAICDAFVYIPQYGGGTASLNVTVAASIILQSFALWAQVPIASGPVASGQ
ncbi:hypothetical protein BBJ28_00011531 [Nothophytophthora sp. Chile5]|nr:hypothetical protein BBJ28_00011531 [Nothophytophthora sp. Chile5]